MSGNKVDNFFDKYTENRFRDETIEDPPTLPNQPTPTATIEEPNRYSAFTTSPTKSKQTRLLLRWPNGQESAPLYSFIMDLLRPTDQRIYLLCTSYVISISGHNLAALMTPLKEHFVDQIECYIPTKWPEPSVGETVITNIDYEPIDAALASMKQ